MLRHLSLRDFVIVDELELAWDGGFSVLTGETGAGKSILVDALQLALGSRGDAGVVREGAARAEIAAEFDTPESLAAWLDEGGFEPAETLLLRRTIDAQGKSRAWLNGRSATVAQLREAADHLVDIHGQHAWQSLTRSASVRALLDARAGVDPAPLAAAWSAWKRSAEAVAAAGAQQAGLERERERLAWQIGEVERLAPAEGEWAELEAEHKRLSNRQSLIDAAREAVEAIAGGDAGADADALTGRAAHALDAVAGFDARLAAVVELLQAAQAQLQDAAHTLSAYLHASDPDPEQLAALDERLSAWMSLARRYRRRPEELPALLAQWHEERRALEAAADLDALARERNRALAAFEQQAAAVSAARRAGATRLSAAVTQAMQPLGMAGGRFDVALVPQETPQSFGAESAEFRVAGHAGSTPRPLAKVASGGELSRLALAISVTTASLGAVGTGAPSDGAAADAPLGSAAADTPPLSAATLIFDEIDAGVGGAVAETVGRLMKQLGRGRQVLAVTHLPQVAACADHHFVVAKRLRAGSTLSTVRAVEGEVRVAEVARMLGGERLSGTSLAHAEEMLAGGAAGPGAADVFGAAPPPGAADPTVPRTAPDLVASPPTGAAKPRRAG